MFLRGARRSKPQSSPAEQIPLLEQKLSQIDEALEELGDISSEVVPDKGIKLEDGSHAAVNVVVGNSKLAAKPGFVEGITSMVNESYGYMRLDEDDVMDRLAMGDPGSSRANRVLHIAFVGDRPVGCMSSTFRVPWAEDGCGHWGLVVVDVNWQGKGIASRMVAAAERRLAGMSEQIQMEYEFTPGDTLSERLLEWYEGKCKFRCVHGPPSRRRPEFRKCRKMISEEDQKRGQKVRLAELKTELAAELAALREEQGPMKVDAGGYAAA